MAGRSATLYRFDAHLYTVAVPNSYVAMHLTCVNRTYLFWEYAAAKHSLGFTLHWTEAPNSDKNVYFQPKKHKYPSAKSITSNGLVLIFEQLESHATQFHSKIHFPGILS